MTKSIALSTYYTLFKYDPERGRWFDEFGSSSLEEVKAEIEWAHYGTRKKNLKVLRHRYDTGIPSTIYDLEHKGRTSLGQPIKI
jgi:hypothetical protein